MLFFSSLIQQGRDRSTRRRDLGSLGRVELAGRSTRSIKQAKRPQRPAPRVSWPVDDRIQGVAKIVVGRLILALFLPVLVVDRASVARICAKPSSTTDFRCPLDRAGVSDEVLGIFEDWEIDAHFLHEFGGCSASVSCAFELIPSSTTSLLGKLAIQLDQPGHRRDSPPGSHCRRKTKTIAFSGPGSRRASAKSVPGQRP